MTLEDLIYQRLTQHPLLVQKLAKYASIPAVFFQSAPDDKANGWKGRMQYPRIDYVVDLQHNPERKTSGTLTLNIWSTEEEGVTPPEELEPIVRQLLCGVFLKPQDSPPYALSWARSEPFDVPTKGGDGIVIGMTIIFDVYAFPSQVTTDPDPILAINYFAKKRIPCAIIIGADDIEDKVVPTEKNPALYFRLETIRKQRETNTVAWMDAVIAGHVFAGGEETFWIKSIVDALALDGEVTMLDMSPMFIVTLAADSTLNAISAGQLRVTVRFGILRKKEYAHTVSVNIDYKGVETT